MGDHVERKGTTAFNTPESVNFSCDANFKLLLIRDEKKPIAALQCGRFCAVGQNVQRSKKITIIKGVKY